MTSDGHAFCEKHHLSLSRSDDMVGPSVQCVSPDNGKGLSIAPGSLEFKLISK